MAFDIKVCGMGSPENAAAVSALPGVTHVGFIYHPDSPRHRIGADMFAIRNALDPSVKRVLVSVDALDKAVVPFVNSLDIDVKQFHGTESPEVCARYGEAVEVWKTVHVGPDWDPASLQPYVGNVSRFLLDTRSEVPGGSGKRFDWTLLEKYTYEVPFVLAGGIGPEHLDALIQLDHPQFAGVDLNSRFETAPGEKDVDLLAPFVERLQSARS